MIDKFTDFLVSKMPQSWLDSIVRKSNDRVFIVALLRAMMYMLTMSMFTFVLLFTITTINANDHFGMYIAGLTWFGLIVWIINIKQIEKDIDVDS